jgi:hypothetical protein
MWNFCSFWWNCAKIAFRGNAAFANDWQWLFGYPLTAVLLWVIGYFYAELSGRIQLTLSTGEMGLLAGAAIAYVITKKMRTAKGPPHREPGDPITGTRDTSGPRSRFMAQPIHLS